MARVRMNGGVIGPNIKTTSTSASGIFSLVETQVDISAGIFPQGFIAPPVVADPQFNTNAILLHADGSNGANNNTFLDSSSNNFTVTRVGSTTQGTFSPFSQTGWSNFIGTGNYLSFSSNAAFSLGTGDFTIEFWVYPTAAFSTTRFFSTSTGGIAIYPNNTGNILVDVFGVSTKITSSSTVSINTWTHIAVARSSGTTTVYINGISGGSASDTTNYSNAGLYIGTDNGINSYVGYISNFRMVKGTAVYIGGFTPPTTQLTAISGTSVLTCQSNRFLDNSTNAFAVNVAGTPSVQAYSPFAPSSAYGVSSYGGSMYFNGSTDVLTATGGTNFNFGTGDYTIECWVYAQAIADAKCVFTLFPSGTYLNGYDIMLRYAGATTWDFYYKTGSHGTYVFNGTNSGLNSWLHIAIVRFSGNINLYLNGVSVFTVADSTSMSDVGIGIGNYAGSTYYWNGYISNFRVVKGTAVYTANFTPPTTPLTAIAGTQLLVNGTNAAVYDQTAKNNMFTGSTGNLNTTQSKFGSSSMYFDGTVNSVIYSAPTTASATPVSVPGQFGTGDFTVEFWVWITGSGSYQCLVTNRNTAGGAGTWFLGVYTGTTQIAWINAGTTTLLSTALSINTWHHVAVCRSSGTSRLFIDGALTGTSSVADTTNYSAGVLSIGYDIVETAYPFTGYIDELRISRYARYTSAFTPSTTAFSNQ